MKTSVQQSSMSSSVLNLLNSIIGVGVMTLPYSLAIDGYVLGIILFIFCAWISHIAFKYIAIAAEYTQEFHYKQISEKLFNHRAWGIVVPIIMMLYVSGSLTSYSIAIMDNMFWWADKSDPNNDTYKTILCVVIMYLIVWPLSSLRNLDFMKFNSYLCIVCAFIICFVVIFYFSKYKEPRPDPVPFNFNFDILSTFPLFTVSMCGHFGTPYIYKELKNRSIKRMDRVIQLSGIVLFVLYIPMILCGYFTFTTNVHSDLLKTIAEHSKNEWYLMLANISMIIMIIVHFPITCFGFRAAVESLAFKKQRTPTWALWLITFIVVTIMMLISLFVKDVADVLDVTSSIAGSFVIIIIPASFQIVIAKKEKLGWQKVVLPWIMVAYGLVQLVGGISSTIQRWLK
uniref:Amino acid transporter family protein n=1 Tax=Trepomonas sp. PC1 TaxID=1076344 RepID=A0A146K9G1_9EUKA|eukprot:JAP92069.1 Amino acid transporter family protein [Trepomonas sp. PC1]